MKPQYELGEIWEMAKMLITRARKYFMELARARKSQAGMCASAAYA